MTVAGKEKEEKTTPPNKFGHTLGTPDPLTTKTRLRGPSEYMSSLLREKDLNLRPLGYEPVQRGESPHIHPYNANDFSKTMRRFSGPLESTWAYFGHTLGTLRDEIRRRIVFRLDYRGQLRLPRP